MGIPSTSIGTSSQPHTHTHTLWEQNTCCWKSQIHLPGIHSTRITTWTRHIGLAHPHQQTATPHKFPACIQIQGNSHGGELSGQTTTSSDRPFLDLGHLHSTGGNASGSDLARLQHGVFVAEKRNTSHEKYNTCVATHRFYRRWASLTWWEN